MNFSISNYITILIAYCAIISCLYLFGYWGTFNVNVLEYVTLSDVLKLSIYPLAITLSLAILGFVSGLVTSNQNRSVGNRIASLTDKALENTFWRIFLETSLILFVFGIFLSSSQYKGFFVGLLGAVLGRFLSRLDVLAKFIPNRSFRVALLSVALTCPGFAFAFGRINAETARLGKSPLVVDVERSRLLLEENTDSPVVYLGRLGDYFVLYETATKEIVLILTDKGETLYLIQNQEK